MPKKMARLCTMDTETDPFEVGLIVEPFSCGFYDGECYFDWWGKDCIRNFIEHLSTYDEPLLIMVHNGGKFDFFFLLEFLSEDLKIVNGRILQAWIGEHEFRDSFAIVPVSLAKANKKTEIDYRKLHKDVREEHKQEIRMYQKDDCLDLYELCAAFFDEFGDRLTIGSTALKELQKFHEFDKGNKIYDDKFRPWYFGGRNQCFKSGVISGSYKIYDVNSMYPYVMREFKHPVSVAYEFNRHITKKTTFALIEATNYGALPIRTKTGIDFTCERGTFYASIHEIEAGEETGTLKIHKIKHTVEHAKTSTFKDFVDHFYEKRLVAKEKGDKIHDNFYKLVLNSAYGKFAQNPEHFKTFKITRDWIPQGEWDIHEQNGAYTIWSRPSTAKTYYNVATAASITAAARAVLLRGLAKAVDPVYCDTDSIICRSLECDVDAARLGAWKLEGQGDSMAIAGKKLYAVFDDLACIKQACKGAKLTPEQIKAIADGSQVTFHNPVPKFKLDGGAIFVKRRIKKTATNVRAFAHM